MRAASTSFRRGLRAVVLPVLAMAVAGCGSLTVDHVLTVDGTEVGRTQVERLARSLSGIEGLAGAAQPATDSRLPAAATTIAATIYARDALIRFLPGGPPSVDDSRVESYRTDTLQGKVNSDEARRLLRTSFAFPQEGEDPVRPSDTEIEAAYSRLGTPYFERVIGPQVCMSGALFAVPERAEEFAEVVRSPEGLRGLGVGSFVSDAVAAAKAAAADDQAERAQALAAFTLAGSPAETRQDLEVRCGPASSVTAEVPVAPERIEAFLAEAGECTDEELTACSDVAVLPGVGQFEGATAVVWVTRRAGVGLDDVREVIAQQLAKPSVRAVFDVPVAVDPAIGVWDPLFVRVIPPEGPVGATAQPVFGPLVR